jgi:hypothetical protein
MSGISTVTKENIVLSEGALYLGYINALVTGTLLGAVSPGSAFKVDQEKRSIMPDGAMGPIKDLEFAISEVAYISAGLMEFTEENLRAMILGADYASGTTLEEDEAVGTGAGVETEFTLDHSPVKFGSVIVTVAAAAVVEGVDYAVDYTNGTLQFVAAPTGAIVATYTYISGDAVITGGEIVSSNYLGNVAIVGKRLSNGLQVICRVKNAVCTESPELSFNSKEETVAKVKFESRYLASAVTTRPWDITYINTVPEP